MSDGSSEFDEKEDKPLPPPRKKRRIRKKQQIENEEYNENQNVAKSLNEKFSAKKKRNDDAPVFEIRNGVASIKNSENHDSTLDRALDNHHNRIFQWEENPNALEGAYRCAFCHEGVHREAYGELFGPYYADIQVTKNWPSFLAKKPNQKTPVCLELWFHGECALWAPEIQMEGCQLTNLSEKLEVFWGQHCDVCRRNGASIPIQNRRGHYLHYRCAKTKGYNLDEHGFTCNF